MSVCVCFIIFTMDVQWHYQLCAHHLTPVDNGHCHVQWVGVCITLVVWGYIVPSLVLCCKETISSELGNMPTILLLQLANHHSFTVCGQGVMFQCFIASLNGYTYIYIYIYICICVCVYTHRVGECCSICELFICLNGLVSSWWLLHGWLLCGLWWQCQDYSDGQISDLQHWILPCTLDFILLSFFWKPSRGDYLLLVLLDFDG